LLAAQQTSSGAPLEIPGAVTDKPFQVTEDPPSFDPKIQVPDIEPMTSEQEEQTSKILEPFIQKGLEIAESLKGWS